MITKLKTKAAAKRAFKKEAAAYETSLADDNVSAKTKSQAGQFYYRAKDYKRASELLQQSLDESKGNAGCFKTLALSYTHLGKTDNYTAVVETLTNKGSRTAKQTLQLAELLARDPLMLDAAEGYARIALKESDAKIKPGFFKVLRQLAAAQLRKGENLNHALSLYDESMGGAEHSPAELQKYHTFLKTVSGRIGKQTGAAPVTPTPAATPSKMKSPEDFGQLDGKQLIAKAQAASKIKNNWGEALHLFEQGLAKVADPETYHQRYGDLLAASAGHHVREGNRDKAREVYEDALKYGPNSYNVLVKYGAFLIKDDQIDRATELLEKAESFKTGKTNHITHLANCLMLQRDFPRAERLFEDMIAAKPAVRLSLLPRLADVAAAMKNHKKAAAYIKEAAEQDDKKHDNLMRRHRVHEIIQGNYNNFEMAELDTCQTFFTRNLPKLDNEQTRILEQIIDKGICLTHFDDLFGDKHLDMWNEAVSFVDGFINDPDIRALEDRITSCPDFNKDPFFAGSFKPSIINYRQLKGEMFANEAPYQFYLHKRILDITNSYNEMLSKIRNVALWINPPITAKNLEGRKGSQIWHRDQEDQNILKCFIYYSDIGEDNGATEYVPYSKVKPERKHSDLWAYPSTSGYPGKYLMDKHVPAKDRTSALGRKGSIMFFDTNGFHRGGFVSGDRRVITMSTFLRPITPYARTNTKLSTENFNETGYPFEATYGLKL